MKSSSGNNVVGYVVREGAEQGKGRYLGYHDGAFRYTAQREDRWPLNGREEALRRALAHGGRVVPLVRPQYVIRCQGMDTYYREGTWRGLDEAIRFDSRKEALVVARQCSHVEIVRAPSRPSAVGLSTLMAERDQLHNAFEREKSETLRLRELVRRCVDVAVDVAKREAYDPSEADKFIGSRVARLRDENAALRKRVEELTAEREGVGQAHDPDTITGMSADLIAARESIRAMANECRRVKEERDAADARACDSEKRVRDWQSAHKIVSTWLHEQIAREREIASIVFAPGENWIPSEVPGAVRDRLDAANSRAETFHAQAVAEREECAKVCDGVAARTSGHAMSLGAGNCATMIRERTKVKP